MGFQHVVQQAWNEPTTGHIEPYQNLFQKLRQTGKYLATWSRKSFVPKTNVILHEALFVILQLDIVEENRPL
jgi:hypothetical protein